MKLNKNFINVIKVLKQRITNLAKRLLPFDIRIFLRKLNWRRLYFQQSILNNKRFNYYCPIAKREFKLFIKVGNNLLTPSNGANARQRLVWHYLENKLNILNKKYTLLHIAPELSYYEKLSKCKNLRYIVGDKMVSGYSNQKGIINMDLTNLNFETNVFDLIICNHVLEHIQDDKKAIFEMYRVLKKGGKAVITVPINEKLTKTYEDSSITKASDRIKHFGQWDHVRWYGLDIKERISKVGFDVEMNRYSNNFSKKDYIRYGFSDSLIIIANKL